MDWTTPHVDPRWCLRLVNVYMYALIVAHAIPDDEHRLDRYWWSLQLKQAHHDHWTLVYTRDKPNSACLSCRPALLGRIILLFTIKPDTNLCEYSCFLNLVLPDFRGTVCQHLRMQLLDSSERLFKLHKQSAVYQNNTAAETHIGTGAPLIVAMRHGLNAQTYTLRTEGKAPELQCHRI